MRLRQLRNAGFHQSAHIPFTRLFRVRCSACEAMVINGIATHETGCPNAVHECAGCNALLPTNQRFCGDCQ